MTPGPWVAWRLLGANNREIGRSAKTYVDLTDCLSSIAMLRRLLPVAARRVGADPATGSWYWRLDAEGTSLAVAGRAYRRQSECVYSLEQFLRNAPAAQTLARSYVDLTVSDPAGWPLAVPSPRSAEGSTLAAQAKGTADVASS